MNSVYGSWLSQAVGVECEEIELDPPATVGSLLAAAERRHGAAFRDAVCRADGGLLPGVMVSVNGTLLHDPTDASLDDRDEVLLFSAISGG